MHACIINIYVPHEVNHITSILNVTHLGVICTPLMELNSLMAYMKIVQ